MKIIKKPYIFVRLFFIYKLIMAEELDDLENQAPITYLVKTVKGVRRNFIYYDPDIFEDTVLLSASLLIGEDETPFTEHYNTSHENNNGTSFLPIEDFAITIYAKPTKTSMRGSLRVLENSSSDYFFDETYDPTIVFSYDWYIETGDAVFNATTNTENLDGGKNVTIDFGASGAVRVRCRISNPAGCYRDIIRILYPGILTKKMLVIRNSYC